MRTPWILLGLAACSGGTDTTAPPAPTPTVALVEVTPASTALFAGDSIQLTATPRTAAGVALSGKSVTWTSVPATVATVSGSGLLRAVAAGQATVTATVDGKSGSAAVSVTVLGPPVTATIGANGGSVSSPLPDGSTAELLVPPGALATPTLVALEPGRPATGAAATLLLRPTGLRFARPVELRWQLPTAPSPGTLPAIAWQDASGAGYLPLRQVGTGNQYVARLTGFGAPQPVAAGPGLTFPAASATDSAFLASLQIVALRALLDSARAAITRFQANRSLPLAEQLNGVMSAVASAQSFPAFQPDGGQLLGQWRTEVCTRLDQVVTDFRNLPVGPSLDFPQFFAAVNVVIGWLAVAQVFEDPDLSLPFAGCTTDTFGALRTKANQFVDWVIADLNARQAGDLAIRFNEFIDTHIPRVLGLQVVLEGAGMEEFSGDLTAAIRRLLTVLRSTAWTGCRDRNDIWMLARLLEAENLGAEELSDYETGDLAEDVEECGTDVYWTVRDQNGNSQANGRLGGTAAGQVARSVSTAIPVGGSIRLTGLVRVLVCPGDVKQGIPESLNQEQLHVLASRSPAEATLAVRPVPTSGPATYLHNDSLVYTPAALRGAVGLPDDQGGTVVVRLERVGNTCGRGLELLPDPAPLIELNLQLAPETCVEDDLRAGAPGAVPGRSVCEPEEPPPPPPPPTSGCPAIRVGPGYLPASSDSLAKLTCISALLVQTTDPVALPALTMVTEALAVRFPTVSFSAPSLSWVGATQINSSNLVLLAMPALSIVAGPLQISSTQISTIEQVGCATVYGGLQIIGNLNLPQAQAVAKGDCMTVYNGKTVRDNKP